MSGFIALLLRRLAFIAASVVLVGSALVMFTLLLALWSVRVVWLKVTGRPAVPFAMRGWPRGAFRRTAPRRGGGDVIDVQARHLS
jgi:hypothetical protein